MAEVQELVVRSAWLNLMVAYASSPRHSAHCGLQLSLSETQLAAVGKQGAAGRRRQLLQTSTAQLILTLAEPTGTPAQITEATKALATALGVGDAESVPVDANLSDLVALIDKVADSGSSAAQQLQNAVSGALTSAGVTASISIEGKQGLTWQHVLSGETLLADADMMMVCNFPRVPVCQCPILTLISVRHLSEPCITTMYMHSSCHQCSSTQSLLEY